MAIKYYYDKASGRWYYNQPYAGGERAVWLPKGIKPPKQKVPESNAPRNRGRAGVEVMPVSVPINAGVVTSRQRVPLLSSTGLSTIVTNTETYHDLNAAALGAFSVTNKATLPTQPSWLAGIADLYSKYRWRKLRFVYLPSCPTTTQGSGVVSIGYDRLDADPGNATAMQQSFRAITFPPYAGYEGAMALTTFNDVAGMVVFDVDVSRFDKAWYPTIGTTQFGALATNIQNAYCPCTLYFGSVNGPATATSYGTWFIQYICEFIEPVNPTSNV
jgi:hypothetical protein